MARKNFAPDVLKRNQYLQSLFAEDPHPLFERARTKARELSKEEIMISSAEGRLIAFLVAQSDCCQAVEIGTLTGYSGLWILWALRGQPAKEISFTSFEKDPVHADISRQILEEATKDWWKDPVARPQVRLIEGDAEEKLREFDSTNLDLVFIDGNKAAYGRYLDWTENNLQAGGLLIADNVFLAGQVYEEVAEGFSAKQIAVMKAFNQRLADSTKWQSALIPSSEGLFVARKK
jgi:predicted O-methyltransferase YrrM